MVDDALKGGVNVAGVQAKKSGWIQSISLWQSTIVVVTVHVSTAGVVDGVLHPDKKTSPTRGRKNNFFMDLNIKD